MNIDLLTLESRIKYNKRKRIINKEHWEGE